MVSSWETQFSSAFNQLALGSLAQLTQLTKRKNGG